MEESLFVWKDGRIAPWADAVMHIADSAVAESQMAFEEFRCIRDEKSGKTFAFRLDSHIERLRRAAAASSLGELPASRKIARAVADVVAENGFEECCIRMTAARRGRAARFSMGASVDDDLSAEMVIACWRNPSCAADRASGLSSGGEDCQSAADFPASHGISIRVSSWRMGSADSIQPQIRSSAMAGLEALSKREALSCGAKEAIILNTVGLVCHSTCGNVFVVRDGVLSTPPLSAGTYDGVMRDTTLNLAMDMDIPAIEEQLTRTDLYMADEAFLADDVVGILPITSVDSCRIGKGRPGSVTEALRKRLDRASRGKLPEYSVWLTEICS